MSRKKKLAITNVLNILRDFVEDDKVQEMKNYLQHGSTSTFEHSVGVAVSSYRFAKLFHLNVDMHAMLKGAMLHDFYLYDYHVRGRVPEGTKNLFKIHCFHHPLEASRNAQERFDLGSKEVNIIESHMFPLTLTHVPKSREAFIVSLADKYCCIKEQLRIA